MRRHVQHGAAARRWELGIFIHGEFSSRMERSPGIKQLRERINIMHKAVLPILTDDTRKASWSEWEYNVVRAAWAVRNDKKAYYGLRTTALVSSITVPSLVGLNLSGTGGTVVRWLTFAFSLVAAITTGMLTLYRLSDRWLMYRKLNEDLMKLGLTLVESSGTDPQIAWEAFTNATNKAMTDYNKTYEHAVIQAAASAPNNHGQGKEEHPRTGSSEIPA
jgi:hypothetical protein